MAWDAEWDADGAVAGTGYVEQVNSAAIGRSGKLPARGIIRERANHHTLRYAFAHISPVQAPVGASKNSGIRSCKDMLWVGWIDRNISIDRVRDSVCVQLLPISVVL